MSLGYFKKRRCPVQLSYSTTLPHTNARIIVFSRRYIIESKPKHRGDIEREHTVYSIEDDYEESMLRDRGRVVGKIYIIDRDTVYHTHRRQTTVIPSYCTSIHRRATEEDSLCAIIRLVRVGTTERQRESKLT